MTFGYQPNNGFTYRTGLSVARQEADLFTRRGDVVFWWQAAPCSCPAGRADNTDQARSRIGCKVCGGTGRAYFGPQPLRVILSGVDFKRSPELIGVVDEGSLVLTLPASGFAAAVGEFDLLKTTPPMPFEGELVTRGTGHNDRLAFPIAPSAAPPLIFQSHPDTGLTTPYTVGVDFTCAINSRTLTWVVGHVPAAGSVYSVKYDALFIWQAHAPALPRSEHAMSFGRKMILKRHIVAGTIPGIDQS